MSRESRLCEITTTSFNAHAHSNSSCIYLWFTFIATPFLNFLSIPSSASLDYDLFATRNWCLLPVTENCKFSSIDHVVPSIPIWKHPCMVVNCQRHYLPRPMCWMAMHVWPIIAASAFLSFCTTLVLHPSIFSVETIWKHTCTERECVLP